MPSARLGGGWRRAALPLAALFAGLLGYFVADRLRGEPADAGTTAAPSFRLLDLSGEAHSLSDFPERFVLVNFWATWCPPCREEIPVLIAAQSRHAARGLQVVGIAVDTPEAVAGFHARTPFNFPSLLGGDDALGLVADYGNPAGALPYSVLVGPDGAILARHRGAFTAAALDTLLTKYLPDTRSTPRN